MWYARCTWATRSGRNARASSATSSGKKAHGWHGWGPAVSTLTPVHLTITSVAFLSTECTEHEETLSGDTDIRSSCHRPSSVVVLHLIHHTRFFLSSR